MKLLKTIKYNAGNQRGLVHVLDALPLDAENLFTEPSTLAKFSKKKSMSFKYQETVTR